MPKNEAVNPLDSMLAKKNWKRPVSTAMEEKSQKHSEGATRVSN